MNILIIDRERLVDRSAEGLSLGQLKPTNFVKGFNAVVQQVDFMVILEGDELFLIKDKALGNPIVLGIEFLPRVMSNITKWYEGQEYGF